MSCCRVGPAAALGVEVATLLALALAADEQRSHATGTSAGASAGGGAAGGGGSSSSGVVVGEVNPFDAAIVVRCVSQRVSK